ncbi:phage tail fiber protein [Brenneria sp. HEZEL_4_2_4]|uniref:phage tail fiber protein n=1 Tax=Brenneria sp. HEZEL_4_2_4 TaxID=3109058 RepID=UPI003FA5DC3A
MIKPRTLRPSRSSFQTTNVSPRFNRRIARRSPGQPIDIPTGRWIDIRVQMPVSDESELLPDESSDKPSDSD